MSEVHPARPSSSVQARDTRPAVAAQVTTTVTLPSEALTIIASPPEMISQLNVEQVLGLPARTYLELLREQDCALRVTHVGKLRLVDRNKFRVWLEARPEKKRTAAGAETTPDKDEQLSEDEQVRLGIKPTPRPLPRRR